MKSKGFDMKQLIGFMEEILQTWEDVRGSEEIKFKLINEKGIYSDLILRGLLLNREKGNEIEFILSESGG